jgi:hypothetical protein
MGVDVQAPAPEAPGQPADDALQAEVGENVGNAHRPQVDVGKMGEREGHGGGDGFR